MKRVNSWSPSEDDTLRLLWLSYANPRRVLAAMPNRSYRAIVKRAFALGLKRPAAFRCDDVPELIQTISDTDAAWLAGFVDGEGTISLDAARGRGHAYLSIANTNREVLELIRRMVGSGSVVRVKRYNPNDKDGFAYHLKSALWVEAAVSRIAPFLRIKRRQAGLILEFISRRKLGVAFTEADHRLFVGVARLLNRKGRSAEVVEVITTDPEV